MPAHPATAGRKAGPVCPRLPWGSKKCFPGGASENGPRFNRHQGTGRLFPAVFRKNVTAGAPFFLSCPVLLPSKNGQGEFRPAFRSPTPQCVPSGAQRFPDFHKACRKKTGPVCYLQPGLSVIRMAGMAFVSGTPRAYGHTVSSKVRGYLLNRYSARVRTHAYSVKNYGEACRQFPRSEPFSSGCFRGFALHAGAIKKPAPGRMFRDAGWEKSVL